MPVDEWNPAQYEKFRAERLAPFFDLLSLIRPRPQMRIIDLGCGTGEITGMLVDKLPAARAEGIDSSASMLAKATARAHPRLSFRRADVSEIEDYSPFDLVFSNAAFHWVPDNERLMKTILTTLKPGAQIAVQLPKNEAHPSHQVARALVAEGAVRGWLGGLASDSFALSLSRYAELLFAHGFREQVCLEKIYGHVLAASGEVVEWTKGTLLVPYLSRLTEAQQTVFLQLYRERLLRVIGDEAPYFFAFRRLLFWGVKG